MLLSKAAEQGLNLPAVDHEGGAGVHPQDDKLTKEAADYGTVIHLLQSTYKCHSHAHNMHLNHL